MSSLCLQEDIQRVVRANYCFEDEEIHKPANVGGHKKLTKCSGQHPARKVEPEFNNHMELKSVNNMS